MFPSRLLSLCLCRLTTHNSGLESHDSCRKVLTFSVTGTSSDANGAVMVQMVQLLSLHIRNVLQCFLCISNFIYDTIKPHIHLNYCVERIKSPIITITRCYSDPCRGDGCMARVVFNLSKKMCMNVIPIYHMKGILLSSVVNFYLLFLMFRVKYGSVAQ